MNTYIRNITAHFILLFSKFIYKKQSDKEISYDYNKSLQNPYANITEEKI